MTWLAPVAALLGVIVGGVLNAIVSAEFERRRELAAGAVGARMVRDELELVGDTVRAALREGRWGPILDPGLPYARGLWAVEHRKGKRAESAWVTHSGALARCLTYEEWETVSAPYDIVDRTSLRLWTDQPDRDLTDEARTYLERLVESVPAAVAALEQTARGRRKTRLQWLIARG